MRTILILFIAAFVGSVQAQKIKFKVSNYKDTTIFLVKYVGKNLFYADTAQLKNGIAEFNGSKQTGGILALYINGQKPLDFIYNNEEVQIEVDLTDLFGSMIVKKSEENKVFVNYVRFITDKRTEVNKWSEERSKLSQEDSKYKELTDRMDATNKAVIDYQKNLVATNPTKLIGKIVKMSLDVDVPEPPKDANGKIIDSNFRFNYYRKHFWDNIDLRDDRLVNTPIFHQKLEYYFGKNMMIQHWDTVLNYAFAFCDTLNPKSKVFEYCVTHLTSSYQKSNIMGMDKVFVYMFDKYYCTNGPEGKPLATWVKPEKIAETCEKMPVQKRLVMGVKPPNLILRDTTDTQWKDFYSLKSEYTILYFWDPECGHCKKITPKLETLYKQKFKDRNIEIFSVGKAVGEDFPKWKKFIKDNNLTFMNVGVTNTLFNDASDKSNNQAKLHQLLENTTIESLNYQSTYDIFSTPRVFVLDKDKKIIGKNLSISQLEDMMDMLQGKKDLPKLFPPDPEEDEQMH
jgi:thiol-disulfide isomerase/thioredoxin